MEEYKKSIKAINALEQQFPMLKEGKEPGTKDNPK